jgi:hypothetical protein
MEVSAVIQAPVQASVSLVPVERRPAKRSDIKKHSGSGMGRTIPRTTEALADVAMLTPEEILRLISEIPISFSVEYGQQDAADMLGLSFDWRCYLRLLLQVLIGGEGRLLGNRVNVMA